MSDAPSPLPAGTLAVVALPIGNLGDLTPRAVQVLACADWVAAEDTRTVGRLLAQVGVKSRLLSYHDWNEAGRAPSLVAALQRGERGAVVSEAGTPAISDPGFDLVRLCREQGVPVMPVPGPCALTAFLSACGLPTDRFTFLGFPPRKPGRRKAFFAAYADRPETLVFYESPRRVLAALSQAREVFGDRPCALAREMTKPYEEFLYAPLGEVLSQLETRDSVRGEICWGVAGASEPTVGDSPGQVRGTAAELLEQGLPLKQAARELARRCGLTTKTAYATLRNQRDAESS
ncbi:MAG TPA: 16S rRNA (cytidine(1402)-2'-O)-methyltransferase [Deferrisomatales bacterium]|nr:16S rRNA (cytidine(1402)-2'-O)-methyltransferase [Deferrisomatales bacterium]